MSRPLLEARGIVKRYGRVEALRGADFTAYPGEVVALIGDNGAGKSTLVKILSGAAQPDDGDILLDGRGIELLEPQDARDIGIETVYQDLALAPHLDPAGNVFLGRELLRPGLLGKLGFLDKKGMRTATQEVFRSLHVQLQTTDGTVGSLSGGQRQGVALGRAVNWANKIIFLDEPTAALGVVQVVNAPRPYPSSPKSRRGCRSHQSLDAASKGSRRPDRGHATRREGGRVHRCCEHPNGKFGGRDTGALAHQSRAPQ